jgi:hypothetical protein
MDRKWSTYGRDEKWVQSFSRNTWKEETTWEFYAYADGELILNGS